MKYKLHQDENQALGDRIATKAMMKKIDLSELEKYIEHESPYVRSSVAIGICHLGGEKAYELWLKLMDDPEELIVGDAILHAGMLNDQRCLGVIIEAYTNYGYHLRSRVINSLPYFNDPKAEEFFKKLKEEEKDPALRKIIDSVEENFK